MNAGVAQLVEHSPEERVVGGSSPPPSTKTTPRRRGCDVRGAWCLRTVRAGEKAGAMSRACEGQARWGREHLDFSEHCEGKGLVTRDRVAPQHQNNPAQAGL